MDLFLRIDINIVAMISLGLVFVIAYRRLDKQDILNKMFLRVSVIILFQLLFETLTCVINKRPELWLVPISIALHMCLFITAPILTYSWLILIKNMLIHHQNTLTRKDKILVLPAVFNAILTLLSPIYRFIFYVDSANVYHRGPLYIVAAVITYFYFAFGFILIIKNKRKMVRQEFVLFHIFSVLPMIGGVVQTLFYGVLLMWSSVAFSLGILFSFLQERMVQLDDLTGVWNRHSFESYLARSISLNKSVRYNILYVDIDNLKQIND